MKGDFTRQTFRASNHYRGVLQQQGRVQLDADWNEQVLLQDHLDRLVTEDTIGPHGAPVHAGMAITGNGGKPPFTADELLISPGHYYVCGILCENEKAVRLDDQPDLPGVGLQGDHGSYIAFLDVWRRFITSAEEPSLREVALGGPDTATRSRTVWQVRVRPKKDAQPPRIGSGRLRARAHASGPVTSPCDAPTGTGFRRLDNQLYRVEIRDSGDPEPGTATFLWSRENGSVTARLLKLNGNDLVLDSIGRDGRLSFDKGWVEVTNSGRVLRGETGFLGSIGHVQGNTVTVTWAGDPPPDGFDDDAIVRRWESGPLPVRLPADPENDWIELESGVQIQFRDTGFRAGDYWLIPARTANLEGVSAEPGLAGNVDWPRDANGPEYLPPEGIRHAYADIADLELGDGGWTITDRRPVFPPITELAAEVEVDYCGGDGQQVLAGHPLPQPLEVSVTRQGKGVPGAIVRFQLVDSNGRLADSFDGAAASAITAAGQYLDAAADQDGIARCWWRPAIGTPAAKLRVIAGCLDSDRKLTHPLIDFSAAFAQASGVGFDPAGCTRLAGADTVHDAIHTLAAAPVLVPSGGDGQHGTAGTDLPRAVTVLVRTGCGDPVAGAMIEFSVTSPSGAVAEARDHLSEARQTVEISTDREGSAECWWHLGVDVPVQTLTATLTADAAAEPVTFVAGVVPAEGPHVTDVLVIASGIELPNNAEIAAADLADGLTVLLDGQPNPDNVNGMPVLTVTLDLPYPLSRADRDFWGPQVPGVADPQALGLAGSVPLTLAGLVAMDGRQAVTWKPTQSSPALLDRLFSKLPAEAGGRVLCHLALDGRATGGAGYTQWNWLVASNADLVLVPHLRGKLQLPSGREMMAHTVPRDAVRAAVPAGVHIKDEPAQNPGTARRAAGNAFRNKAERELVLVAAVPYAAAARAMAAALADAVQVRLEVIAAADPAAEAANRIAAGQPVDGILTDDASTAAVTALPDFPEGYPL
jgi:Family of unknown function (DUF6519)